MKCNHTNICLDSKKIACKSENVETTWHVIITRCRCKERQNRTKPNMFFFFFSSFVYEVTRTFQTIKLLHKPCEYLTVGLTGPFCKSFPHLFNKWLSELSEASENTVSHSCPLSKALNTISVSSSCIHVRSVN